MSAHARTPPGSLLLYSVCMWTEQDGWPLLTPQFLASSLFYFPFFWGSSEEVERLSSSFSSSSEPSQQG